MREQHMFSGTRFENRAKRDEPLRKYTTLGVGGPADDYVVAESSADMVELLALARAEGIGVVVLGGGSNVLVSDEGFRGLVIHNKASSWRVLETIGEDKTSPSPMTPPRWTEVSEGVADKLSYDERSYPSVLVRVDSGALLQRLMVEVLDQGVTGLEWFAGIPASVGGAVYMNLHGGRRFFGDLVREARLVSPVGTVQTVPAAYFCFAYDWSVLHETDEVVLDVTLALRRGSVEQARAVMVRWMRHKNESQPKRSSGCVFQNITEEDRRRLNLPTTSTGYVIDKLLHLKGRQVGGAKVSEEHGNFMVNIGSASAQDFVTLITEVRQRAKDELGLELREEVRYVGPTARPLSGTPPGRR